MRFQVHIYTPLCCSVRCRYTNIYARLSKVPAIRGCGFKCVYMYAGRIYMYVFIYVCMYIQTYIVYFTSNVCVVAGGSSLTVRGAALPKHAAYQCQFVGVSGIVAYPDCGCDTGCSAFKCVSGVWQSAESVVCAVPNWRRIGVANVTLLLDGKRLTSSSGPGSRSHTASEGLTLVA